MSGFRQCSPASARGQILQILAFFSLHPEGDEVGVDDQSTNRLSARERRRPKERRRGTGINFWTKDVSGWSVLPSFEFKRKSSPSVVSLQIVRKRSR